MKCITYTISGKNLLILRKVDKEGVFMRKNDNAVSPVIGVLLMLVVTIIIAAVVSGFAGGLISGQKGAPSMTMDITIKNTGEWQGSYFLCIINSVSEPIPTKDIKIYTEWINVTGISGGNITAKGLNYPNTAWSGYSYQSPVGNGPGIQGDSTTSGGLPLNQFFGNYTLMAGTSMNTSPGGFILARRGGYGINGNLFEYNTGTTWKVSSYDGMMALLGNNWNKLRKGDEVTVKVLHIPSGKFIFNKNVIVES